MTFKELNLSVFKLKTLIENYIITPFPIQQKSSSVALNGRTLWSNSSTIINTAQMPLIIEQLIYKDLVAIGFNSQCLSTMINYDLPNNNIGRAGK